MRTESYNGAVSKKDFVMGSFTMEAEAFINTAMVSNELNLNYSAFNKQIADLKAGKIKNQI